MAIIALFVNVVVLSISNTLVEIRCIQSNSMLSMFESTRALYKLIVLVYDIPSLDLALASKTVQVNKRMTEQLDARAKI